MHHVDLEVYISVVERGSFASAARHLGLTRSAVSRRIDGIEHKLGVRLLDRTTKHISVTDPGQVFYARGVKIVSDMNDAELAVRQDAASPRGTLKLTCAVMIGLYKIIPHMPEFLRVNPDLRMHLHLSDTPDDPNLEENDVAITWGPQPDSALLASKLGATRQVICATPGYIAQHGRPSHP